jgi:hypothetical protein
MADAKPGWKIEGEYFESCNCEVLCPCLLSNAQARPTDGHCDAIVAFQIAKGSFATTDISGLNAVVVLTTPDAMAKGNWTYAVYVDSRANPQQRAALEAIFGGSAGGPLAFFAPLITKRLPPKAVPITFAIDGERRKLEIPGVTDVAVEGISGARGQQVWLDNVGHFASSRLSAARGTSSKLADQGLKFDNTGRNGHFAPISWSNG